MAPNPAKRGNEIAQASLEESRRQYREQKAREKAKKDRDLANATAVRAGDNFAHRNSAAVSNNMTQGFSPEYSLLSMSGTSPVFTELMGASTQNKLGG